MNVVEILRRWQSLMHEFQWTECAAVFRLNWWTYGDGFPDAIRLRATARELFEDCLYRYALGDTENMTGPNHTECWSGRFIVSIKDDVPSILCEAQHGAAYAEHRWVKEMKVEGGSR